MYNEYFVKENFSIHHFFEEIFIFADKNKFFDKNKNFNKYLRIFLNSFQNQE